MNVFELKLNDNEIIFDVGIGCESESIDQRRSYVGKKIIISLCFFSRYSLYNGYGGSFSMNINYSMCWFFRRRCRTLHLFKFIPQIQDFKIVPCKELKYLFIELISITLYNFLLPQNIKKGSHFN